MYASTFRLSYLQHSLYESDAGLQRAKDSECFKLEKLYSLQNYIFYKTIFFTKLYTLQKLYSSQPCSGIFIKNIAMRSNMDIHSLQKLNPILA